MADIELVTTVSTIRVVLSLQDARALLAFFGGLDPNTAPTVVKEISRKFRSAVENETYTTVVQ